MEKEKHQKDKQYSFSKNKKLKKPKKVEGQTAKKNEEDQDSNNELNGLCTNYIINTDQKNLNKQQNESNENSPLNLLFD